MGGLSKKAYQYEKLANSDAKPVLTIDGGSLLFEKTRLAPSEVAQAKVTAAAIVKSYNLIGYDAVGVSKQDLIAGLDYLKEIVKLSDFPWLSANLVDNENHKPVFLPSVIVNKGELRIGIIGLTSPHLYLKLNAMDQATVLEWSEVLPNLLTELSPKCDILVLLSNLSAQDNTQIANKFSNIHLIIQAGISTANKSPQQINNTLICQTEKQGKHIGVLDINWSNGDWGSKKPERLKKNKNSLDRLLWQLSKYDKYKDPSSEFKDRKQLRTYRSLLAKKKNLENEIRKLTEDINENKSDTPPSTYKNRFIAISTDLPDHKGVQAIIDDMNNQIAALDHKKTEQSTKIITSFAGSATCGNCHQHQATAWKKSSHARAYQTLINRNKQFSLSCLPCHITGDTTMPSGISIPIANKFQAVGCENCHGPGKDHIKSEGKITLTKRPAKKICLKCHTSDHDDSFEYQQDVKKLGCLPE